jgi:hypothetical protein
MNPHTGSCFISLFCIDLKSLTAFLFQAFQANAKVVPANQVSRAIQQEKSAEQSSVFIEKEQCCWEAGRQ